jgi:hypothetical protein
MFVAAAVEMGSPSAAAQQLAATLAHTVIGRVVALVVLEGHERTGRTCLSRGCHRTIRSRAPTPPSMARAPRSIRIRTATAHRLRAVRISSVTRNRPRGRRPIPHRREPAALTATPSATRHPARRPPTRPAPPRAGPTPPEPPDAAHRCAIQAIHAPGTCRPPLTAK